MRTNFLNRSLAILFFGSLVLAINGSRGANPEVNKFHPPTAQLITPTDNLCVALGSNITLSASGTSSDSVITEADYYDGNVFVGWSSSAPYTVVDQIITSGTHVFTAVLYDNYGLSTVTSPRHVILNPLLPVVNITAPAANSVVLFSSTIPLSAKASSYSNSISKVKYYDGSTYVGTGTGTAYNYAYQVTSSGTHSLTANAVDSVGNIGQSPVVNVLAVQGLGVGITSPSNGAFIATAANINFSATAVSGTTSVASVNFYKGSGIGGTLIGSSNVSPYSVPYQISGTGAQSFYALVTDNLGNTARSSPVTINSFASNAVSCTVAPQSGNQQTLLSNTFAPMPLMIEASSTSGLPLQDATVTFTVTNGNGELASNNTGTPSISTITEQTDGNGMASAYLYALNSGSSAGAIQVTATCGGTGSAVFSENTAYYYVDSDGDGYPDVFENAAGSDPSNPASSPVATGTNGFLTVNGTSGKVIIVDEKGSGNFRSIQDAINAVTSDYTTIVVNDGVYDGSIAISQYKILLKSAHGAANTIIDLNDSAAGVYVSSDSVISGFTIKDGYGDTNGIPHTGGAVFVDQCAPEFLRCVIMANAGGTGAVAYNNFGLPIFISCTIANNYTTGSGGSAIFSAGEKPLFYGCIIDDPQASAEVAGLGIQASYCDLTCINGTTLGVGNISADPALAPDGHIEAGSPCIGNGSGWLGASLDMDNEIPLAGGSVDIGSDQYTCTNSFGVPDWWVSENGGSSGYTDFIGEAAFSGTSAGFAVLPITPGVLAGKSGTNTQSGGSTTFAGPWNEESGNLLQGAYASNVYIGSSNQIASATVVTSISSAGCYDLQMTWPKGGYSKNALVNVVSATGTTSFTVDEAKQSNKFNDLGTFALNSGTQNAVIISGSAIVLDTLKWVPVPLDSMVSVVNGGPIQALYGGASKIPGLDGYGLTQNGGSKWSLIKVSSISGVTADSIAVNKLNSGAPPVFTFNANVPISGYYQVWVRWQTASGKLGPTGNTNAASAIVSTYSPASGIQNYPAVSLDQTQHCGQWVQLINSQTTGYAPGDWRYGGFSLNQGSGSVALTSTAASGYLVADAARFVLVPGRETFADDNQNPSNSFQSGSWQSIPEGAQTSLGFSHGYHLDKTPASADYFGFNLGNSGTGSAALFVWNPSSSTYSYGATIEAGTNSYSVDETVGGSQWRAVGPVDLTGTFAAVTIKPEQGSARPLVSDGVALVQDVNSVHSVPDWWQYLYFGMLVPDADATASPCGDGYTLLEEYEQGRNPEDYYQGVAPGLAIKAGNGQFGAIDAFLPQALTVQVEGQDGQPAANAPVTFSVTSGSGGLALSNTAASLSTALVAETGSTGLASVYLWVSGSANQQTVVKVVGTGYSANNVIFDEGTTGPNSLVLVGGTNQTGVVGEALPLTVQATNASGVPLENTGITFALKSGSNWIGLSSTGAPVGSSAVIVTDTGGVATAYLDLLAATGSNPIQLAISRTGSSTGIVNVAVNAMNANDDDDGDGYPNYYEYLRGTDPESGLSFPTPDIVVSGTGGDYSSIQDAIDSVTEDYTVIEVEPGNYTENLNIANYKILLISASGAANTIIDGGEAGSTITVSNDSVIQGFTIRGGAADAPNTEGGGLSIQGGSPQIRNCVITENESPNGGAVGNQSGNPTFLHCTLTSNSSNGAAVSSGENGTATFINSILWDTGCSTEVTSGVSGNYCDVYQGLSGIGNINADPMVSPDGHLRVSGTLTNSGTSIVFSPCIQKGGSVANIPETDMDGEIRPHWIPGLPQLSGSSLPDIGADEFKATDGILPDWWLMTYFGQVGGANETPLSDPDQDGVDNFQEYLAGTNPAEADAVAAPVASIPPGTYAKAITVSLYSSTPGAIVRYTTDGSAPSAASPEFTSSKQIVQNTTIYAQAWVPGLPPSAVVPFVYYISGAIGAGSEFALYVSPSNVLYGWGDNSYQQLLNSSANPILSATAIFSGSSPGILAVSGGEDHSVALWDNNTVSCWGSNNLGQLGNGSTSGAGFNLGTPVQTASGQTLTNVIAIASASDATAAADSSGSVWAWGGNNFGQNGIGINGGFSTYARQVLTRLSGRVAPLSGIKAVVAGSAGFLAVDSSGAAWMWGNNDWGQAGNGSLTTGTGDPYAHAITSLGGFSIKNVGAALLSDFAIASDPQFPGTDSLNQLYSWGYNDYGNLGIGKRGGHATHPLKVVNDDNTPFTGVISVTGGTEHTIALRYDGTVWGWGATSAGRLGVLAAGDTSGYHLNPEPVLLDGTTQLSGVIAISSGDDFSIALRTDGSVVTWGSNTRGQMADGLTTSPEGFTWENFVNQTNYKDSDNDGFPDLYEQAAGSDQNSLSSTPFLTNTDGTLSATGSSGKVIIVDTTGAGDYRSIQDAINAVGSDYTTIVVNDGVYYGGVAISTYKILLISAHGAAKTVIDLDDQAAGIYVSSNSIVSGFTIRDGLGGLNGVLDSGGGIFVDRCAPLFSRCYITRNQGDTGAAIYNNFGTPTFINCTVSGNYVTSPSGAQIFADGYKPLFINSVIDDTQGAPEFGGAGIEANYSSVINSTATLGVNNVADDPQLLPDGHLVGPPVAGVSGSGSPCIGNGSGPGGGIDLDGELITSTGPVDIGVDQYVSTDGTNGIPDWWDIRNGLDPTDSTVAGQIVSGGTETNAQSYADYRATTQVEALQPDLPPPGVTLDDVYQLNSDGSGVQVNGPWTTSTNVAGESGTSCLIDSSTSQADSVSFVPNIPETASYEVFMWWPHGSGLNSKVPVQVDCALGGSNVVIIDETKQSNKWNSLGVFPFSKGVGGSTGRVTVRRPIFSGDKASYAPVVADAFRFVEVPPVITVAAEGSNTDGSVTSSRDSSGKQQWGEVNVSPRSAATAAKVRVSKIPGATFTFTPRLLVPGYYKVSIRWQCVGKDYTRLSGTNYVAPDNSADAQVSVKGELDPVTFSVNEQTQAQTTQWNQIVDPLTDKWPLNGAFMFSGTNPAECVQVSVPTSGTTGWVVADAVQFQKVSVDQDFGDDAAAMLDVPPVGDWTRINEPSIPAIGFEHGYTVTVAGHATENDELDYQIPVAGMSDSDQTNGVNYGIYLRNPSGKAYSSNVVLQVNGQQFAFNQQVDGETWRPIGEFKLYGATAYVSIFRGDSGDSKQIAADGIALIRDPDANHDGLPDTWEAENGIDQYNPDITGEGMINGLQSFTGDQVDNLTKWLDGQSPYAYTIPGNITIVSGNHQVGAPGSVLPAPLQVLVTDTFGNILPNAPVLFQTASGACLAESGSAGFANGPEGSLVGGTSSIVDGTNSIIVQTDEFGCANVNVLLPETLSGVDISLQASISGTANGVTFTEGIAGPAVIWQLNDGAGFEIADTSGNNFTAQVDGTDDWQTGLQGWRTALELGGTTASYVYAQDPANIAFPAGTEPFTAALAFCANALPASGQSAAILSRVNAYGTTNPDNFSIGLATTGTVSDITASWNSSSGVVQIVCPVPVVSGSWYQAIVETDGTSTHLLVNGSELQPSYPGVPSMASEDVSIADGVNGFQQFSGYVSDVELFRGSLSASQIAQLSGNDTDGDGIPNAWEVSHGLDPYFAPDAQYPYVWQGPYIAPFGFTLSNLGQYRLQQDATTSTNALGEANNPGFMSVVVNGTNDGIPDGWNANYGLNWHQNNAWIDSDGDLYPNYIEFTHQTSPIVSGSFPQADFIVESGTTSSLPNHFTKIQDAINATTADGQVIMVMPGTYQENIVISSTAHKCLIISQMGATSTCITGAGAAQDAPTFDINQTTSIAGFEITGGHGAYISGSASSFGGGGVRVETSGAASFANCYFTGNQAEGGAAIWAEQSEVTLWNCTIVGNSYAQGQIPNADLQGTTPDPSGTFANAEDGAITADGSNALITIYNSICSNTGCDLQLSTNNNAGGVFAVSYSDVYVPGATLYPGTGNIVADPQLTPDGHLISTSPCRGKGTVGNAATGMVPIVDWEVETRSTTRPDIGADEFVSTANDGIPDYWKKEQGLSIDDPNVAIYPISGDTSASGTTTNLQAYNTGLNPAATDASEESDPEGHDPNTVPVPGQTAGTFVVGADGAATYTVPLYVPKGVGGMQPSLSLTYSSHAGNGPFGLGWSLTGLSSITRGGSTYAEDGYVRGVNFDQYDQYYMDGKRLICTGGTPGQAGSTYQTEMQDFSQIDYTGANWQVATKSGLSVTLKPVVIASGTAVTWGVDRVTDKNGNYFSVAYDANGMPAEIDYAPSNRVVLSSTSRVDVLVSHVGGLTVTMPNVISDIQMFSANAIAREYKLTYHNEGSTLRSRITRLTEMGANMGDGNREVFFDTIFDWQGWRNSDKGWYQVPNWSLPGGMVLADAGGARGAMLIDVNNDGLPDLVWRRDELDNYPQPDHGAYLNPGNLSSSWPEDDHFAPPYPLSAEGNYDTGARFCNLSGNDGLSLIGGGNYAITGTNGGFSTNKSYSSGQNKYKTGIWYCNPLSGWVMTSIAAPNDVVSLNSDDTPDLKRAVSFADLTGNGIPELVYGLDDHTTVYQLQNNQYVSHGIDFGGDLAGENSGMADITGNGAANMIYDQASGSATAGVYTWNQSSSPNDDSWARVNLPFSLLQASSDSVDAGGRFVDLEGDGLPSYLAYPYSSNGEAFINQGANHWASNPAYAPPEPISPNPNQSKHAQMVDFATQFIDLNGGGLPDMMVSYDVDSADSGDGGQRSVRSTYLNSGTGWTLDPAWNCPIALAHVEQTGNDSDGNPIIGNEALGVQVIDINGDGFPDIVQAEANKNGVAPTYKLYLNRAKEQVITGIRSGLGSTTTIKYTPLTNKSVYTQGYAARYPDNDVCAPIYVVSSVQSDNGFDNNNQTTYHYSNLLQNRQGRGSLGFRQVKSDSTDSEKTVETVTTYNQDFPLTGLALSTMTTVIQSKVPHLVSYTSNSWVDSQTSAGTAMRYGNGTYQLHFPYLAQTEAKSWEFNDTIANLSDPRAGTNVISDTKTVNTYSSNDIQYGNLTSSSVSTGAGVVVVTNNSYGSDTDDERLGRLQSSEVTHYGIGKDGTVISTQRTASFTYNPNNDQLATETPEESPSQNSAWPAMATAGSGPGMAIPVPEPGSATTVHGYDSHGNEITTSSTGGDLTSMGADGTLNWGSVVRSGSTTYDPDGRFPISVTDPYGHQTQTTTDPVLGVPQSVTDANGLTTHYTAYDGFGRLLSAVTPDNITTTSTYAFSGVTLGQQPSPGSIESQVIYKVTVQSTGANGDASPYVTTWYDRLGRAIRKETPSADNNKTIYQDTYYDKLGRTGTVSQPYFSNTIPSAFTTTTYDAMGRPLLVVSPAPAAPNGGASSNSTMSYLYTSNLGGGTVVTSTANGSFVTTSKTDGAGRTVEVDDTEGNAIRYWYNAAGEVYEIDSPGAITTMTFDSFGRKTGMIDPDCGTWSYAYNSFGELAYQRDGKGQNSATFRDLLGRTVQRVENGSVTVGTRTSQWVYDSAPKAGGTWIGKLGSLSVTVNGKGYSDSYLYDSLGRSSTTSRVIGSQTYTSSVNAYNDLNQPILETYPSGVQVQNSYKSNGFLYQVSRAGGMTANGVLVSNEVMWSGDPADVNAMGELMSESLGSNVQVTNTFDSATGLLAHRQATGAGAAVIQNDSYKYDAFHNLYSRSDGISNQSEQFGYDDLNRLVSSTAVSGSMSYGVNGNILSKPGTGGSYNYGEANSMVSIATSGAMTPVGAAGPHAVTSIALAGGVTRLDGSSSRMVHYLYDGDGNMVSGPSWTLQNGGLAVYDAARTVSYWQSNQPYIISDPAATLTFFYGADGSLVKQYDAEEGAQECMETDYMGDYEVVRHHSIGIAPTVTGTDMRHYFMGGGGRVAVFTISETGTGGSAQSTQATTYMLNDGLGSTEVMTDDNGAVLTDGNGAITGRYSYDAWGMRRNASTWAVPTATIKSPETVTDEGFTGHVQLDSVQLVHMGGRVYDPVIGRVMTADPEVQAPQMSQSYNRYSYCMNNPTSVTDPTGYSWLDAFTLGGSAIAGAFSSTVRNWGHRLDAWMAKNPVVGEVAIAVAVVVVSVVTYGAATPVLGAFWAAVVAGAAGGAAQGTLTGVANNQSVTQTLESAAEDMAIGAATSALTAGAAEGIQGLGIPAPEAGYAMRLANGVIQGAASEVRGGSFEAGFVGGVISPLAGSGDGPLGVAINTVIAATAGGTASEIGGGKFANGAISAATAYLAAEAVYSTDGPNIDSATSNEALHDSDLAYGINGSYKEVGIANYADGWDDFHATLFDDSGQLVLAYRGTVPTDPLDWVGNLLEATIGISPQYIDALQTYHMVEQEFSGQGILLTGHSLGGGMASAVAANVGGEAITFNAAGVNPITAPWGHASSITSYRIGNDVVSDLQEVLPVPGAVGTISWQGGGVNPVAQHSLSNFHF